MALSQWGAWRRANSLEKSSDFDLRRYSRRVNKRVNFITILPQSSANHENSRNLNGQERFPPEAALPAICPECALRLIYFNRSRAVFPAHSQKRRTHDQIQLSFPYRP